MELTFSLSSPLWCWTKVGTIWEGTTNVLSLDLLRVLQKVGPEVRWFLFLLPSLTPSFAPLYSLRPLSLPPLPSSFSLKILEVVTDTVKSRLSRLPLARCQLESEADLIRDRMQDVVTFVLRAMGEEPQCLEVAARDLALSLAHVYISETTTPTIRKPCWDEKFQSQLWKRISIAF